MAVRPTHIGMMVLPAIVGIALWVGGGLASTRGYLADRAQERAIALRAPLHDIRLVPCIDDGTETIVDQSGFGYQPGELAIDAFPAFIPPYGIRLGAQGLVSYRGAPGTHSPPPPPPPTALHEGKPSWNPPAPTLIRTQQIRMDAERVTQWQHLWRREIERSPGGIKLLGFDGTMYLIRYDGMCATTSSPPEESRAGQLVTLFEVLYALPTLSTQQQNETLARAAEISRALDEAWLFGERDRQWCARHGCRAPL